jgi:hypothetical protein
MASNTVPEWALKKSSLALITAISVVSGGHSSSLRFPFPSVSLFIHLPIHNSDGHGPARQGHWNRALKP